MREWKSQGYSLSLLLVSWELGVLQSENVEGEIYLGVCIRKAMGSVLDMFILRSNLNYSAGAQ